ncbi:LysR family transcriptional regulator [Variovorax sp. Sphag1AA]|uniref:LysR family transcriptional regulator n=1 Tax=Variovorax sp. Sphag1AA TaxID=2587027 RepID=UPI0016125020|nr:LysR family transcriptional regulator [Variovorax sp. Sphag1AA]MBB3178758.1 DNA-binding transcriptional LysR family regulator [Variovorax sp. Sphag1AA]
MNYRNADLNLLKVFEALMTEGNVTRAAHKLSLTQPTVSNALRRLRETFDDRLFVRHGAGVRPTRRAVELWTPLARSLQAIRGALEGESFDPSLSDAQIRVTMTDYVSCIIAPRLMQRLVEVAPGMQCHTLPGTVVDFCQALADGKADFAIGAYNDEVQRPAFLRSRRLWPVDFACFMRRGHPLAQERKITPKKFLTARHVDVSLTGEGAVYDRLLRSRGLQRNLVATVSHYSAAYEVVRRSELIAVLPWSEGREAVRMDGLVRLAPPIAAPARTIELFWHERHETSVLHQWLIGLLVAMFAREPI